MSAIKQFPKTLIAFLETAPIPFLNYVITFLCAVFIRQFLESYSQYTVNYFNLPTTFLVISFVHNLLCYLVIAMLLAYLFYYATATSVEKGLRVILPSFFLLLITPLLDLLLTGGQGYDIKYLQPGINSNVMYAYLTIGGGSAAVSLGMRIEVVIILIASFIYFRVKNLSIILSLIYAWLVHSVIFLIGGTPYFLKWLLELMAFRYIYSSLLMIYFYMVCGLILGSYLFYLAKPVLFTKFVKLIPMRRILHFTLLFLLGVVIGLLNTSLSVREYLYFFQSTTIACLFFIVSMMFLVFALSAFDQSRLLRHDDAQPFKNMGIIFLLLSLFYAVFSGIKPTFILCVIMAIYYIDTMPPFNISQIPVLSKLLMASKALLVVIAGYVLIHDNVYRFPTILFWIFLIGYSFILVVLDFKKRYLY